MAWKPGTKTIQAGKGWTDDSGITHPANWMMWDKDTKAKMGVVWWDEPEPYDNKFYWGYKADGKTLIERKIADEDAVDEDGNKIKDEDGHAAMNEG